MCGIAGYLFRSSRSAPPALMQGLLDGIRDRGPDDEGAALICRSEGRVLHLRTERTVPGAGPADATPALASHGFTHDVGLASTRFAIQDPSPAGHQPFVSGDGSVIGVLNGEIYNFLELRRELEGEGVVFRTGCDTEVLVEGFRHWGRGLWNRLNGFWAAALLDRSSGTLTLSRDRLGIAPLYLRETPDGLFFCSSITPLRELAPGTARINESAAVGFIETSLKDFGDATHFAGISPVRPATTVEFAPDHAALAEGRVERFWKPPEKRLHPREMSMEDAVTRVRETLIDAVMLRLRADVPVAFELSGGMDSSSIVAIAASARTDVTTFTIEVPEENEEPYARAMQRRYDIDYRVLRQTEETFPERAVDFARLMEEPFHSPNIYTHFEMRRRMKAEGVDVVLSGSGGDEVLAGYEGDFWSSAADVIRSEGDPWGARRHAAIMYLNQMRSWKSVRGRARKASARLRRIAGRGEAPGRTDPSLSEGEADWTSPAEELARLYSGLSYDEQRRYHLEVGLLPYYLSSNDRFTMAIPIEHRFPFLDYRMVELGLLMPPSCLFHNGWSKYVLRKAMEPFLPPKILWRRTKSGFPFPHQRFLREHRETFEPHFASCRRAGFLRPTTPPYASLLRSDPVKLWRACSTGLWLDSL